MKKINGYLVVRFNDREKREYEGAGLGAYGVIDADLYTGYLDIDRHAMEYDQAESLEEAVELARGLESELDVEEPDARPLPRRPEALLAYVCDELCKHHIPGRSQTEMDDICGHCILEMLADAADSEELRARVDALDTLREAVNAIGDAGTAGKAQGYLQALEDLGIVTEGEGVAFGAAIATMAQKRKAPSMDEAAPLGACPLAGRHAEANRLLRLLRDLNEFQESEEQPLNSGRLTPQDYAAARISAWVLKLREELEEYLAVREESGAPCP